MLAKIIVVLYILGLGFIVLYCFTQLITALHFYRKRKKPSIHPELPDAAQLPIVTVQLPMYNERYVAERLIDCIVQLDYPKEKLQIQVLDDSTDETVEMIAARVAHYRRQGFDIEQITRAERTGFKAGALQEALPSSKGDFIAIFDADFLPEPDFLKKTLPWLLADEQLGLVQTRWMHINKEYSLLTRIQAFALDAHFIVEQTGRNAAGAFMNFNGTAGVWRRSCIEDAGGWSHDTLTEDLDLSYRAQLKGWKFRFLEEVGAPAELPAAMGAIKSQQYRWAKGPAEVSRKLLLKVLFSKLPFRIKWHAFFHLLNSSINIFVLVTALLSVPLLHIKWLYPNHWVFDVVFVFLAGLGALSIVYLMAQVFDAGSKGRGLRRFVVLYPPFLSLAMGLSLHNGVGAFLGLMGVKSPFVRTPKFNLKENSDDWSGKKYLDLKIDLITFSEVVMVFYSLIGIVMAFIYAEYGLLPFHLLLFFGFFGISFYTFKHAISASMKKAKA